MEIASDFRFKQERLESMWELLEETERLTAEQQYLYGEKWRQEFSQPSNLDL